jgi:hypothetical protein
MGGDMTPHIQRLIDARILDSIPEYLGDSWGAERAVILVDELILRPAARESGGWRVIAELTGQVSIILYCDRTAYISPVNLLASLSNNLLRFELASDGIQPGDAGLEGELRPVRWRERLTETARQVAINLECVNVLMALKI